MKFCRWRYLTICFLSVYDSHSWSCSLWSAMSKICDCGLWGNEICLFMRIPLEGYLKAETIWEAEELNLISPRVYYNSMYSHLIHRFNPYVFLYLFLENSFIIRYVWYIILLIQIQYDMPFWEIWNFFDNNYESWETSWSEYLLEEPPRAWECCDDFCGLLRLRLTLRLQISRTKFFFLEGKKL